MKNNSLVPLETLMNKIIFVRSSKVMRRIIIFCMILFVFIVGCEKATSPGIQSKIKGTVLDPSGNPIVDAKILVNFNIDCDYPIGRTSGLLKKNFTIIDSIDPGPPIPPTSILGNYPNPFTSTTVIVLQIGSPCTISVWIEDNFDNEVKTIFADQSCQAGYSHVVWNGKNNDNDNIQNGLYKMLLSAEDEYYCDTLFVFKDYEDFTYDNITPLSTTNAAGHFTIYTHDLPLNYVGDYFDTEGCNPGDFSVTPYIDIWAFHPDYSPVHIDSVLVESGKDMNVSLTFE